MVKITVVFSVALFLFIGCSRVANYNDDNIFKYVNCANRAVWPSNVDTLFIPLALDSFNVKQFYKSVNKKPLGKDVARLVEIKYLSCFNIDSSKINFAEKLNYYPCGKLIFSPTVMGYLLLRKQKDVMTTNGWSCNLIILCVKKNRLSSLLIVSGNHNEWQYSDIIVQKTYSILSNKSFLLVSSFHLYGIDSSNPGIDDFWSRIGLLKRKTVKYYYSSFTIDENGFVKFVPFDEDKYPEYLK